MVKGKPMLPSYHPYSSRLQVGSWLHAIGLGAHAAAFEANHIDGAALVLLSREDGLRARTRTRARTQTRTRTRARTRTRTLSVSRTLSLTRTRTLSVTLFLTLSRT